MQNLIQSNLTTNFESSHELKSKIVNSSLILQLQTILSPYPASGFKEPASFVGSVCSDLVNQSLIQHSMKLCPLSNKINDAFRL